MLLIIYFMLFQRGARLAAKAKAVEDSWRSQHAKLAEETEEAEGATASKQDEGLLLLFLLPC